MEVTGYQVIMSWLNKWGEIIHCAKGFYGTEEEAQMEAEECEYLYPKSSTVIIPLTFKINVTPR